MTSPIPCLATPRRSWNCEEANGSEGSCRGAWPLASTPPGMPGTHPPIFWLEGTSTGISPQYYYVLSDIADQYWLPYVRSASSRFHSAIRRHQFASARQADSRLTRLVPPTFNSRWRHWWNASVLETLTSSTPRKDRCSVVSDPIQWLWVWPIWVYSPLKLTVWPHIGPNICRFVFEFSCGVQLIADLAAWLIVSRENWCCIVFHCDMSTCLSVPPGVPVAAPGALCTYMFCFCFFFFCPQLRISCAERR